MRVPASLSIGPIQRTQRRRLGVRSKGTLSLVGDYSCTRRRDHPQTELSSSRCIPSSHGLRPPAIPTSPVPYGGHWRGRGAAPQSDRSRVRFGAELRTSLFLGGYFCHVYILCLPYANGSAFRRCSRAPPVCSDFARAFCRGPRRSGGGGGKRWTMRRRIERAKNGELRQRG